VLSVENRPGAHGQLIELRELEPAEFLSRFGHGRHQSTLDGLAGG